MSNEKLCRELFKEAGIEINGNKPWDIQVKNPKFYNRVITKGSLGLGESYMDGWWDSEALDEFIAKIVGANLRKKALNMKTILSITPRILWVLLTDFGNYNNSKNIGHHHYDVGDDVYNAMLDKRLVYTCGYWKDVKNLDEAQEAKLDLVCQKLRLKPGMKVLDIGCGWGSFLKFAAEKYGIEGVGVTVSKNQVELGRKLCKGFPVKILYKDYRDIEGKFDAIVSLGMFEHVGPKYYEVFMKKAKSLLKDDGLFLLHTIGSHRTVKITDPWLDKYIFPGGVIPSIVNISAALQKHFVLEDLHNFGYDYYLTLMEWFKNFNKNWGTLKKSGKYNDRFY